MGSSNAGSVQYVSPYTQTEEAEEVLTPAVGKSISQDTEKARASQLEAKSRLRGIRSTYTRFAQTNPTAAGSNGSADKLG